MSFIKEMLQYAIIIGIVILIRVFVITPVKVDGDSMNPTLVDGEVVMLNKISKNYERFDVVVVNYANTKLIKRIIGLPGEHIKFINNKLYINNKLVHDVKLDTKTSNFDIKQINYDVIPEDSYFGGKDGMDEQGIAESLGLANPELVERVMYSDNGEQCFLFYANRDLVVVDVLTGQTINTIPDIPKLEWYAGKDEKQNTYIYGYEGCYVFDSKMQPIMYIESVRHIDLENRKIYLSWYSKEYEAPLYTNEELLQIAQEQ